MFYWGRKCEKDGQDVSLCLNFNPNPHFNVKSKKTWTIKYGVKWR